MRSLVLFAVFFCFLITAYAQPGSPRISMGETPGINLNNSELKGPIKEIIESEYYKQRSENGIDTSRAAIKTIMKFDQNGNETEELKYGRTGKLLSTCTYDNKDPKSVIVKKFIQDTLLLGTYVFSCDDSGKLIDLKISAGKYGVVFRTVYRYNNEGRNDTIITYAGNYALSKNVIRYNKNNQKIDSKSYDYRGSLTFSTSFSYDDRGNITENGKVDMILMHSENLTKRTKIDKYGNWWSTIVEDDAFNDYMQPTKIVKRVIIYY